jgi:predicted nucleotidyltransferase
LDAEVLEVLSRTESALGASQITRLARRGTRPGHVKVLDRLVGHGLVIAEPTNKGHMYRLNRDHVLIPALLAGLDARRRLVEQLTKAVSRLRPAPSHGSLFGSFARADGDADSDIDLVLVVEGEEDRQSDAWRKQMQMLQDQVLAWTGNQLEPLVFSRATLAEAISANEPVIRSLQEEAIRLLGASFPDLIVEMEREGMPT